MQAKEIKDFDKALQYCFLLLKYRKRSENEIRRRLSLRQCPEVIQKKVVARLQESDLIPTDLDFAAEWAEYKLAGGYGINRVMVDLMKRGISQEARDQIRRRFEKEKKEETGKMIQQLIARKSSGEKPGYEQRRKLIRFLLQRGFSYQDIREVFDEIE